jgi:hypothetical protein
LPAKGKRTTHPAGFTFELPNGWRVENGERGAMLMPPGVTVDPAREDNPEVYTIWPSEDGAAPADEAFVSQYRDSLREQGVQLDKDGRKEAFGRYGSIYTFDFVHPARKTPFRVRIFSMTARNRQIALVATGLRAKVVSRDRALRDIAASLDYQAK